jgi:hypothetical protein
MDFAPCPQAFNAQFLLCAIRVLFALSAKVSLYRRSRHGEKSDEHFDENYEIFLATVIYITIIAG